MTYKKLIIIDNTLEYKVKEIIEVADLCEYLAASFDEFPESARIYHNFISKNNDVTPANGSDIEYLQSLEGLFYLVFYPKGIATIIGGVVAAVSIAATVLLKPKIPVATERQVNNSSPNNELSSRVNKPRINGRIPDIFGEVGSTPDLLAVHTIYLNNVEIERWVMCVGRGQYEIGECYDDKTLCSDIEGTTVEFYKPYTHINAGEPYYRIGAPIDDYAVSAIHSNSVNGQTLEAANNGSYTGVNNIIFKYPDVVEVDTVSDIFSRFLVNDTIDIENAVQYVKIGDLNKEIFPETTTSFKFLLPDDELPTDINVGDYLTIGLSSFRYTDANGIQAAEYNLDGKYQITQLILLTDKNEDGEDIYYCHVVLDEAYRVNQNWERVAWGKPKGNADITIYDDVIDIDLSGTYQITSIDGNKIILNNPSSINPEWDKLNSKPNKSTEKISATLESSSVKWVGPFILEDKNRTEISVNLVASNGIYADSGAYQVGLRVMIEFEVTAIDSSNNAINPPEVYHFELAGSDFSRDQVAITGRIVTSFSGRCKIRARRITPSYKWTVPNSQVSEDVKWKDLYSIAPFETDNFGNVTIVKGQTIATTGALAVKERKFNCIVTRQLPRRIAGSDFTTELYSTKSAADIISFICLDRKLGNRRKSEIDFDNIYQTIEEIKAYFGTEACAQFNYTFDNDNLSFEEMVSSVANTIFCEAYRQGNVIKLSFEKKAALPVLLFNSCNKLPNSETRTVVFGNDNDYDGVELEYVSPEDDAVVTYYLPEDQSAINPQKIETIGVRSKVQAHMLAHRAYNKIRLQNIAVEFDATEEADLLVRGDCILVANNISPNVQDGEIERQEGLILYTSQPLEFKENISYTVFLQLSDGSVDNISVKAGGDEYQMILTRPPRLPLVYENGAYAATTYILVAETDTESNAYIVTEKTSKDEFSSTIRAGNYDDRFYARDEDYIKGIITE